MLKCVDQGLHEESVLIISLSELSHFHSLCAMYWNYLDTKVSSSILATKHFRAKYLPLWGMVCYFNLLIVLTHSDAVTIEKNLNFKK